MINAALEKYPVPEEIGALIKGPWYDSAQLALLKFGAESDEWLHVCKVTDTLLDSVQVFETAPQERRQHLFRVVTLLPKELRRWLLSLHHESTALNDAVAVVEFAHLCILRNTPLETRIVDPLPLPGGDDQEGEEHPEQDAVEVGQWYLIRQEGQPPLRARIIFRLQQERRLLFANRTGMEALRLDCDEFAALLARGDAIQLQRGASFSRCLAAAAGVTGESDLEDLPRGDAGDTAGLSDPAKAAGTELTEEEEEQARLWREWEEARARQLANSPGSGHEHQTGESS